MKKLYTNTWHNTGNEPIWVYQTEEPEGTLGSRVGNYVALSKDMSRCYHIYPSFVEFLGYNTIFDGEEGLTEELLCQQFVLSCEEVFCYRHTTEYVEQIVQAMIKMSERFGLGWVVEEYYDRDTYETGWRIYSAEFAKKLHINEDCVYCFSKEIAEEEIWNFAKEGIQARCSMELEPVIMMYPDGSYDEDEAYVVYYK